MGVCIYGKAAAAAAQEKAGDKLPPFGLKYHLCIRQAETVERALPLRAIHWGNLPAGLVKPDIPTATCRSLA